MLALVNIFKKEPSPALILAYAGAQLPQRVVAKTAFIAYALSNTIGLGVLTGGAVRMRLYGAAGLEASVFSRAIAFNSMGFTGGIVVVGAGKAGWQLIQNLRAQLPDTPITLVTACAGDVYDKPLLSVAMAKQIRPAALLKETGAAAAARWQVRLLAHTQALHICTQSQTLRTTHGPLRYASLVLAHGAESAMPAPLHPGLCWRISIVFMDLSCRCELLHFCIRLFFRLGFLAGFGLGLGAGLGFGFETGLFLGFTPRLFFSGSAGGGFGFGFRARFGF